MTPVELCDALQATFPGWDWKCDEPGLDATNTVTGCSPDGDVTIEVRADVLPYPAYMEDDEGHSWRAAGIDPILAVEALFAQIATLHGECVAARRKLMGTSEFIAAARAKWDRTEAGRKCARCAGTLPAEPYPLGKDALGIERFACSTACAGYEL